MFVLSVVFNLTNSLAYTTMPVSFKWRSYSYFIFGVNSQSYWLYYVSTYTYLYFIIKYLYSLTYSDARHFLVIFKVMYKYYLKKKIFCFILNIYNGQQRIPSSATSGSQAAGCAPLI